MLTFTFDWFTCTVSVGKQESLSTDAGFLATTAPHVTRSY